MWKLFLCFSFCSFLHAVPTPIKNLAELGVIESEKAVKVLTARVVLADYPLIRRDFPITASMNRKAIDNWLLKYGGFIAKSQVELGLEKNTNTEIRVLSQSIDAYRPAHYGRAFVVKTEDGLIDVKGAGAKKPKIGSHSNGLATLPEMIREFMFEKLVHEVLRDEGEGDTIETYAVIDLGFSANVIDIGMQPAAQVLRQAHVRQIYQKRSNEWLIEQVLRKYGLSSGWDVGKDYLIMNIQYSLEKALVDFGCYFATKKFCEPLVYYGYCNNKDPKLLVNDPSGPEGVQPDPKKSVLLEKWNFCTDDDRFSSKLLSAKTKLQFSKKRRWLAKYLKNALLEQRKYWQAQKTIHEKPENEEERPAKKIREQ